MTGLVSRFRQWLGWFPKASDPSVIFYGDKQSAFDNAKPLLQAMNRDGGRLNIALFSDQLSDWAGEAVLPLPVQSAPAMALLLATMKVRCVVALSEMPAALMSACEKRGTIIVGPNTSVTDIIDIVGRERTWQERSNRPVGRYLAERLYSRLEAGNGRTGGVTRFNSVEALKEHLAAPKIILCLGNGPSSEDPAVLSVKHDTLFRANHSWQARGVLVEPDVVFTGMQASMKKITNAVICVLGDTTEKVLLMVRAKNAVAGKLDYLVAGPENCALPLKTRPLETSAEFRPTSGAVMVAMAVALRPEKLIIAGIDMFAHPDGAYPGDNKTPNAYTATHSYDNELEFLLIQLKSFEGKLVILSDELAKEWAVYNGV